jgi:hypothetical protein
LSFSRPPAQFTDVHVMPVGSRMSADGLYDLAAGMSAMSITSR